MEALVARIVPSTDMRKPPVVGLRLFRSPITIRSLRRDGSASSWITSVEVALSTRL